MGKYFGFTFPTRLSPLTTRSDIILQMLRDVASGMRFLHTAEPPIVHADLKAKNCLVDRSFKVKVADFGK